MKKYSMFKNMDKGALYSSDMKQKRYKVLYGAMVVYMLIYLAIVIIPCLWLMLSGFKDVNEMYAQPARFFPREIKLSKLAELWNRMSFYKYYINTFIMAIGCVIADVFVSGLAGYVLSRLKPRGSKFVLGLYFW